MKGLQRMEHYFVHHLFVAHDERVVVDHAALRLNADEGQLVMDSMHQHRDGKVMALSLKPHEKAFIKSISVVYCANDTGIKYAMQLQGLFPPQNEEDGVHPDVKGVVCFEVPAFCSGQIPLNNQCIYSPNVMHLGFDVRPYLGMEASIAQGHSSAVTTEKQIKYPDYELYAEGDPILAFMLTSPPEFPEVKKSDFIRLDDGVKTLDGRAIYRVPSKGPARVRRFFRDTVCPLIRYSTASDGFTLQWNSVPQVEGVSKVEDDAFMGILLVFRIEYDVLTPFAPHFEVNKYKF